MTITRTDGNEVNIDVEAMDCVYERPISLAQKVTHYCPGCTHGVAHRLLAEALDELGMRERAIMVAPVGCAVFAYEYFNIDGTVAAHGRAPAMATGVKRVSPEKIVMTYQGDGDLASIGLAEIMHAAVRGEKFTTIFINNAVYGMTGGQMAPTSLPNQKTTSSPFGRDPQMVGMPMRMSEIISQLDGAAYVVRRSLHDVKNIRKAKKAILTALKVQESNLGFSMVELLSTCPTNWGMTPIEAMEWVESDMVPYYPIGDYKVIDAVKEL